MKPLYLYILLLFLPGIFYAQPVVIDTWTYTDSIEIKKILLQSAAGLKANQQLSKSQALKALELSQKINYTAGAAAASNLLGNIAALQKDYLNATAYLEKARSYYQQNNDEYQLAQVLKKMGDVYAARSYFRQSSDCYREASPLLRKTNQQALLSECIEGMATVAATFGRYKNAAGFFLRSLVLKKTLNDKEGVIQTTAKLAAAYMNAKMYDSALYFINEVKQLAPQDKYVQTVVLSNEAIINCFLKKTTAAETALYAADKMLPQENNTDEKVKICIAKTVYGMATDDKGMTKTFFDSVGSLIAGSRNPEMAVTGFNYLAEINTIKGDYKTAYSLLRQAELYKDLYRTDNIDRMKAEADNAAEISLKEKEIQYLNLVAKLKAAQISKDEMQRLALLRENILKDSSLANQLLLMEALENEANLRNGQLAKEKELSLSLSRENNLKQQLLTDERNNRNFLLMGLGAMTLLGGIIFYQFKKQQKKNSIINKQSAELEVLNKEIHHRVKNNLQVISSMLDLQSQSLNDERATAIIKEGIQRVQSMAFIHQNLYQGNAVNSVNMNEYIKMLSNHLFQTYNIRTDKIKLHTQIEDLSLHTDTAIPLGMILNELISNALKYAFKEKENGEVWVTMKKTDNELLLQVKDNGVGLKKDFNPDNTSSFGYEIINAFLQKMKARMNVDGSYGTDVQIIISKFKTTG